MVIYAIDLNSAANPTLNINAGPTGGIAVNQDLLQYGRLAYTLIRGSCGSQAYSDYYTKVTFYLDYSTASSGMIDILFVPTATTTTTFGLNSITFTAIYDTQILPAYLDFGSNGAQYGWTTSSGGMISVNTCSGTSYLKVASTSNAKRFYNSFLSSKLYTGVALTYTVLGTNLDSSVTYTPSFLPANINYAQPDGTSPTSTMPSIAQSDLSTVSNSICTGATLGKNMSHLFIPYPISINNPSRADGLQKYTLQFTQTGGANAYFTFSNVQFYGVTVTDPGNKYANYLSSYADTVTTGWRTNEAGQTASQQLTTNSGTKYIKIYSGNSVAKTYLYKSASGKVNITFDTIFVATNTIKTPSFAFFLNDVLQANWTSASVFKAGTPNTEYTMTYTATVYLPVGNTPLTFRFQDLMGGTSAGVKNIRISDVVVMPVAKATKVEPAKTNTGVVAGAAIGGIIALILIIIAVYFIWKWYQGRNKRTIIVKDEENYNTGGGGGGEFTYANNNAPVQQQQQQPQPQPQNNPFAQPNGLITTQQQPVMYQQQQPMYVDPNAQYGYQPQYGQPQYGQPQPGPTTVTINVKV